MRALRIGDRVSFTRDGKEKRGIVKGNASYYRDRTGRYYSVYVPDDALCVSSGYYSVYENEISEGVL